MITKLCKGECQQYKPLDEFYHLKTAIDGRSNHCRECTLIKHKAHRAEAKACVRRGYEIAKQAQKERRLRGR